MGLVQIDDDLHEQLKKFVEENKVDYPTMQFFVNQAIKEKLRQTTTPRE